MSIKVQMMERERRNRLKIWKLIRIKIQVLPTDTVAQWVEHRRDEPRTWVQIIASAIFLFCSVAFFLSLLPCRRVGRYNFTSVFKDSTMLIQITTYKYESYQYMKYIINCTELVDCLVIRGYNKRKTNKQIERAFTNFANPPTGRQSHTTRPVYFTWHRRHFTEVHTSTASICHNENYCTWPTSYQF